MQSKTRGLDLTDKEVMFSVKNGELDKLRILYERYKVKLYNYFYRLSLNKEVSEDLVQDLFVKLIKYGKTYKGDGLFTTWLFQIAHNTFLDQVKKKKDNKPLEDVEKIMEDERKTEDEVHRNEDVRILQQAMSKLTEPEREVLVLSKFNNIKYEEIAKIMGCAVGTVKSRVYYALQSLQVHYSKLSDKALL